jgi:asparagine synthetase B (glutamine-hydrolysing)
VIVGLHVGDETDTSSWGELVNGFAAWLGLVPQIDCRTMPDGRKLSLAFLEHPANVRLDLPIVACSDFVVASSRRAREPQQTLSPGELWRRMERAPSRNEVRIAIKIDSGELRTSVPIAAPDQVFYSDSGRGFALANDMRLVTRWAGGRLDPAALFALLQYGTIPAPLSLSDKVVRIAPGHLLRWRPHGSPVIAPLPGPADSPERVPAGAASEALLLQALDTELEQAPQDSVLYFSGGVDSSLLASRLRRIGRSDVTLVNFAFGPEDGEAKLAGQVASHLGLRCEHVFFDPGDVSALLARVGRDYSYPFGDDSTIPTNLLVHASVKALGSGRTVVEGTGADGGFGPVVRHPDLWQRLYAVPVPLRALLALGHSWTSLWRYLRRVPRLRMLASLAHKSMSMNVELAAVLSANAFDGVAYSIPSDIRTEIGALLEAPLRLWGAHLSPGERFELLDLIYVCAGRFAAKSLDPLRRAGMDPVYPFLEPGVLRASFRLPWAEKARSGEGKVVLKRLLAREIPEDWVYRRKSAFDAPLDSILIRHDVQAYFHDVVLCSKNPVLDLLDIRVIKAFIERREPSSLRFLWTILFVSAWLSQMNNGLTRTGAVSSGTHR